MAFHCSAKKSATMFFRVKRAGSYQYLQIVHSVRQGDKVRQQVFETLGRLDELKASGRLEALIRSGSSHCEKFALIDAHAARETQAVTVQRIGPDLVEWSAKRPWKPLRRVIRRRAISSGCGCVGRRKLTLRCLAAVHAGLKVLIERSNAKDPAPLKVKEVWVKERRKDAHAREAIVAHLKDQLRNGDKSLVGNKGHRRYPKVEGSGHFVIDEKPALRYPLWIT
jgi:hypothetical protein